MSELETISVLGRRISVSLPLLDLQDEIKKRLIQTGRQARLTGFRPGKAPLALIQQHYGNQIREEVFEKAVAKSLEELLTKHQLRITGTPTVEYKPLPEKAKYFEYIATFEIYPEVKIGDLSKASITQFAVEIKAADVNKTLDTLVKQHASYLPVKRAAKNGDAMLVNLQTFIEGVETSGTPLAPPRFVLGDGQRPAEFDQQLLGLKTGAHKTFTINHADEPEHGVFRGKSVSYQVQCLEVNEVVYPAIDTEFAQTLGVKSGSIKELKAEVNKSLQQEIKDRIAMRTKRQVWDALLNAADFALPQTYIEAERERLLKNAEADLKQRGVSTSKLDPTIFDEPAARSVKLRLLMIELVNSNNLQANPEQIKAQVALFAQNFDDPDEIIAWCYSDKKRLEQPTALATENNVVQWVLERVTINHKNVPFDDFMGSP